jgi:hypothetical protein
MLAHGFSIDDIVELVRAGLATAKAERMVAGGMTIEVPRVRITEAGRRALARCCNELVTLPREPLRHSVWHLAQLDRETLIAVLP